MESRPTILERAYQLARSGEFINAKDVERALSREGYLDAPGQLYGKAIRDELTRLCREARGLPAIKPRGRPRK